MAMEDDGRDVPEIAVEAGISVATRCCMAKQLVADVMSDTLAVCTVRTTIEQVAQLMVQHRCGEIPVVEDLTRKVPLGVLTDRDIVCRLIAKGKNPMEATAEDCMSQPAITVREDEPIEDAVAVMERHQIRRVPVVDANGECVGMLAQADIAWTAERVVGELVREVSRDTGSESR
jgi:CBS domain-containing protein